MSSNRYPPIPRQQPGPLVFFGSMELTLTGRKIHDALWQALPRPIRVAILETPAGFELNSAAVAARYAEFFRERLAPYQPETVVVPARKKETPFSPDDPAVCGPLLRATYIYLGAGSPTYTVRQLRASYAWRALLVRHRQGVPLCFESAATLAVSRFTIPVYEIYKVGEDPHWKEGLDLLGSYGLTITFVPHWNNTDGGAALDTSRCYIGQPRFAQMLALLPAESTVVGIDDHTALVVQPARALAQVMGLGTVTVLHQGREHIYPAGATIPLAALGEFRLPADLREGVDPEIWEAALTAQAEPEPLPSPPEEVLRLVAERAAARARRDWATADQLRSAITQLGWWVDDTPTGPALRRLEAGAAR
jgi:hypothetical protein